MPGCLIAPPSANVAATGTPTWAVSSANGSYPIANSLTLEPDVVAKAAGTTATYRLTFGAPVLLEGFVAINTNLGGVTVTLTNNGGMATQSFDVPDTADGLGQNVYFDLRGLTGTTASQWNLVVVSAPAAVAIGTVLAITEWLAPHLRWDYDMARHRPVISHRSARGKRFVYRIPTKTTLFKAEAHWAEDRNLIRALRDETSGSVTAFTLVPDEDDDQVHLVQFTEDDDTEKYKFVSDSFSEETVNGIVEQPIEVEEVNSGVAL